MRNGEPPAAEQRFEIKTGPVIQSVDLILLRSTWEWEESNGSIRHILPQAQLEGRHNEIHDADDPKGIECPAGATDRKQLPT